SWPGDSFRRDRRGRPAADLYGRAALACVVGDGGADHRRVFALHRLRLFLSLSLGGLAGSVARGSGRAWTAGGSLACERRGACGGGLGTGERRGAAASTAGQGSAGLCPPP